MQLSITTVLHLQVDEACEKDPKAFQIAVSMLYLHITLPGA